MSRLAHILVLAAGVFPASLGGCALGPTALRVNRSQYNEVLRETKTEQLLLNLVRLKYHEEPLFLDVGSVTTQFTFKESADIVGTINEGPTRVNPDGLDLSAGIGYEENPTITFTPLQGKDFVRHLMSPLQGEVLVLLSQSGWSIDRILRLTVQSMNGLDNASGASGPTPLQPPAYEEFARACRMLRSLQKNGLLEMGYESRRKEVSGPLPLEGISLPDVVEAVRQGYDLCFDDEDKTVVLEKSSPVLVWRISEDLRGTAEVREIVQLLGLKPDQNQYEVYVGPPGQFPPGAARGQRTAITMVTRSLMGTLFYLSQAIEVPEQHRLKNFVTTTRDSQGQSFPWEDVTGDLLRVRCRSSRPRDAAVAVQHWGYWHYVDNSHLTSKSTLALLGQLFALQAGGAEGVAPVLTLPIGG